MLLNVAENLKNYQEYAVLLFIPDDEVVMDKGKSKKESTHTHDDRGNNY